MKLIANAKEHKTALRRLELLMRQAPKSDEIGVLGLIISEYEKKQFPIKYPTALDAVKFRMEQNSLRPIDLSKYLGSRHKVSDFLRGKRGLSVNQMRRLYKGLCIPAEVLLGVKEPNQ